MVQRPRSALEVITLGKEVARSIVGGHNDVSGSKTAFIIRGSWQPKNLLTMAEHTLSLALSKRILLLLSRIHTEHLAFGESKLPRPSKTNEDFHAGIHATTDSCAASRIVRAVYSHPSFWHLLPIDCTTCTQLESMFLPWNSLPILIN